MSQSDDLEGFLVWWCKDVPERTREDAKRNCRAYLKEGTATHRLTDAWAAWQARGETISHSVPVHDVDGEMLKKLAEHLESGSSSIFSYDAGEKYAKVLRRVLKIKSTLEEIDQRAESGMESNNTAICVYNLRAIRDLVKEAKNG
jgi:hypothetical protein